MQGVFNVKISDQVRMLELGSSGLPPTWKGCPRMPTPRRFHLSFVLSGHLYVGAGRNAQSKALASLIKLDGQVWVPQGEVPEDLAGPRSACTVLGDTVYASCESRLYSWQPGQRWQRLPDCPKDHRSHSMASDEARGLLWLVSGRNQPAISQYNTQTGDWTSLTPLPEWRYLTRCVYDHLRHDLLIPAGTWDEPGSGKQDPQSRILVYNLDTGQTQTMHARLRTKVWGCDAVLV